MSRLSQIRGSTQPPGSLCTSDPKKETFSWLGYGQLDNDRFNPRYSKMLLPLYCPVCSISDHTRVHKHLTGMQRMYLFSPANSNVQAVNLPEKMVSLLGEEQPPRCRTIALPENFPYPTYLKHLGEFCATLLACKAMP